MAISMLGFNHYFHSFWEIKPRSLDHEIILIILIQHYPVMMVIGIFLLHVGQVFISYVWILILWLGGSCLGNIEVMIISSCVHQISLQCDELFCWWDCIPHTILSRSFCAFWLIICRNCGWVASAHMDQSVQNQYFFMSKFHHTVIGTSFPSSPVTLINIVCIDSNYKKKYRRMFF